MKKLIITSLFLACLSVTAFAQTVYVYSDASIFPLYGKIAKDTYEPYSRLPLSLKETVRPAVWGLGRASSGLFIRFRSNAGDFSLKWKSTFEKHLINMTDIGVRGLALYVYEKGEWMHLASPKFTTKDKVNTAQVKASYLIGEEREYMLYLSLYDGVLDLQIGVPEGKIIAPSSFDSPKAEKPIITYGTSILQGASASHPGLCGTAQLSRRADRVVINLGFSGNCRLEPPLAEYMASYPDPGLYIIDNWNGDAEIGEKGLEKCILILLGAHPDTPVVVVDRPMKPTALFDDGSYNEFVSKKDLTEKVISKLKKEGYKNLYHITPDVTGRDNASTSDGTHFTDAAFEKWVDALMPTVKKVYHRHQ